MKAPGSTAWGVSVLLTLTTLIYLVWDLRESRARGTRALLKFRVSSHWSISTGCVCGGGGVS